MRAGHRGAESSDPESSGPRFTMTKKKIGTLVVALALAGCALVGCAPSPGGGTGPTGGFKNSSYESGHQWAKVTVLVSSTAGREAVRRSGNSTWPPARTKSWDPRIAVCSSRGVNTGATILDDVWRLRDKTQGQKLA
jgi:hypothetical protein